MYLSGINNVSISLSLYCLVLFYMATEERLKPFSPFSKFLCIKAILFFSFWQACAFTVLLKLNPLLFGGSRDSANTAQSVIISVEMVFAAVAQAFAFNYRPFTELTSMRGGGLVKARQISIKEAAPNALRATGNVIKNIGYVLNVKDVISDAHNTFMKADERDSAESEMQLEDIMKRNKPFTWSDEDDEVVQRTMASSQPPESSKNADVEARRTNQGASSA
jgi:hypothetical protein